MPSEWEEPRDAHLLRKEPFIEGVGWGSLDPKRLQPETWKSLLLSDMGRGQYRKFVTQILNRIRYEESNLDEIKQFADMIGSKENPDFMRVAIPAIPELNELL